MIDYTQDTLPEWVKVGTPVVVLRSHFTGTFLDYEAVVTKIGKRDIKVAMTRNHNVERVFRVKDLRGAGSSDRSYLADPAGEKYASVLTEQRLQNAQSRAYGALEAWKSDKRSYDAIIAVQSAFNDLKAELDDTTREN